MYINDKFLKIKLTHFSFSKSSDVSAVNLAYDYTQPSKESNVPPLFIMHGLMGSASNWSSISKVLAKTGRKVILTFDFNLLVAASEVLISTCLFIKKKKNLGFFVCR